MTDTQLLHTDGARERNVGKWARIARSNRRLLWTAAALAIIYNVIGVLDILSTGFALMRGGTEANPLMAAVMEMGGNLWIEVRLVMQLIVSAMIVWFPHPIVLRFFAVLVLVNASVVLSNLSIAGII